MVYTDIDLLRQQINQSAKEGKPFLFAVNYELNEGFFVEQPLFQSDVHFNFLGRGNKSDGNAIGIHPRLNVNPVDYTVYEKMFSQVQDAFESGVADLVNLTVKTPIETNLSLDEIFALSRSPYQLYVPGKFVCFSPERFVKITNGLISSNPMKGTIDASIPNAKEEVLNNPKELAEHKATVELIKSELEQVSSDVEVVRYRYLDLIESQDRNLYQVSSEIVGRLPENYMEHLGDIIFNLLPAGSIAGSPKKEAVELLKEVEPENRGYYCGVAGYFDGEELDTTVLIRFIEDEDGQLYFRSGGGVTHKSVCENEYEEVLKKIYFPFV